MIWVKPATDFGHHLFFLSSLLFLPFLVTIQCARETKNIADSLEKVLRILPAEE